MATYAEYFESNRYKSTWSIGDRVFGKYKKIPFTGSVGNDSVVDPDVGPQVSVFLDLPVKVDNEYKTVLIVKPKELKRLKNILEEDDEKQERRMKLKTKEKRLAKNQKSV